MTAPAQAENERRYRGTVASPGLACGALVVLDTAPLAAVRSRPAGTPGEERGRLERAVADATAQLEDLLGELDDEAAGIVAFQIAMLEDESFLEPALAGIAAGRDAGVAWGVAMAAAIADYEGAEDDYFRARAVDLADIRERVADRLDGIVRQAIPQGSIVVADDLSPTRFLATDWRDSGIALAGGSSAGHVAILARARGVPMVVGLGLLPPGGEHALLDAQEGCLVVAPSARSRRQFEASRAIASERTAADARHLHRPGMTAAGEPVKVGVNLAGPEDTDAIDVATCDGAGLVRTEFLFGTREGLPAEEAQVAAYRRIVAWAQGRPVTIRA